MKGQFFINHFLFFTTTFKIIKKKIETVFYCCLETIRKKIIEKYRVGHNILDMKISIKFLICQKKIIFFYYLDD